MGGGGGGGGGGRGGGTFFFFINVTQHKRMVQPKQLFFYAFCSTYLQCLQGLETQTITKRLLSRKQLRRRVLINFI